MVTLHEILKADQSAIRVAAFSGKLDSDPADILKRGRVASLKPKAVSVASAIRDGTATAELVREFLQEDIPSLDTECPSPGAPEIEQGEELADMLRSASAFALIKAIGALMSDDPDTAGKAVREYLDVRRRAEKSGIASVIINPPGEREPLDPAFQDPPIELYRMIYLERIEDPIKQWRELWRFLDEDSRAGLVAKRDYPDRNYR